jgi:hypothetical protein
MSKFTMVEIMNHYKGFEPIRRAIETPKTCGIECQMQKQMYATRQMMRQLADLCTTVKQQVA